MSQNNSDQLNYVGKTAAIVEWRQQIKVAANEQSTDCTIQPIRRGDMTDTAVTAE